MWGHFFYFRLLVVCMAYSWGRRTVSNLYRFLDSRKFFHRTKFNNFLNKQRWNPSEELLHKAHELIARLKPRPGEEIKLILDDTKNKKRGKKMEAVSWIRDSVLGKTVRGHMYVTAILRFRGFDIPLGIRLYVKKELCASLGVSFRKTTQLAAELIESYEPPEGVKVQVLFDSYYLCPTVVKACRRKDFRFISTLKSNRNLYKNGRTLKVGNYGKNLFARSSKRHLTVTKASGVARYKYVNAGIMNVSDLGKLHVIFSQKGKEPKKLGVVTDDLKLSAEKMIKAYDERWAVEVFFKDGKQLLGLGQYQNGSYRAAVTHLHLVCFAYALLTHIAIDREGAKGREKNRAGKLSTGNLQDELRRIIWNDLTAHLKKLSSGKKVMEELGELLVAA